MKGSVSSFRFTLHRRIGSTHGAPIYEPTMGRVILTIKRRIIADGNEIGDCTVFFNPVTIAYYQVGYPSPLTSYSLKNDISTVVRTCGSADAFGRLLAIRRNNDRQQSVP